MQPPPCAPPASAATSHAGGGENNTVKVKRLGHCVKSNDLQSTGAQRKVVIVVASDSHIETVEEQKTFEKQEDLEHQVPRRFFKKCLSLK